MKKGDVLYSKFGDKIVIEAEEKDGYDVTLHKTIVTNVAGKLVRSAPKKQNAFVDRTTLGIMYFYSLDDIGNMEKLCDPKGPYASNIQKIQENYEKMSIEMRDIIPFGERINDYKKQMIIDSYFDIEKQKRQEEPFIQKHFSCFGRLDFDTKLEVGHSVKYFQTRHHDVCYITKGPYRRDGQIQFVNWRSEIADFYYNQDKTVEQSLNYLDIYEKERGTGVQGIEYTYNLMLKRSYAMNPFSFRDLYIGGKHSEKSKYGSAELYQNGSVDPFLIQIIEEKRLENKLTDIIVSIQANQNEMIRHMNKKGMIIQGCAGSGKTMILLHRISYLIYNKLMHGLDKSIIIVPNNNFNMFIDELADNLEIEKMPRMTMHQYYFELIKEYQNIIDYDFDGASKTIIKYFDTLGENDILYSNRTISEEKYSEEYEYKLCDFYDSSLKRLYSEIDIVAITDIAKRLNIEIDLRGPGYIQLNNLYKVVTKEIETQYSLLEEQCKKLLNQAEVEYKKYYDILLALRTAFETLPYLFHEDKDEILYSKLLNGVSNIESFSRRKEELEEQIKELEVQVNSESKGFLRLLSRTDNQSMERLDAAKKNLHMLKEEFGNEDDIIPYDISFDNAQKIIGLVKEISSVISSRKDSGEREYREQLEYLEKSIMLMEEGTFTLDKGIEIFKNTFENIRQFESVVEIEKKISESSANLEEIRKLKPTDEEKETLKVAEKTLKNRRFFIFDLFKEMFDLEVDQIESGYQLFSLLALYCLHIGRLDKKLEFIFIDEGQDYSESEYRILRAVHNDNCIFEVYGDIMQCITENRGLRNWDYLKSLFEADYYELKENYRNTVEIAEYINQNVINVFNAIGFRGPSVIKRKKPWKEDILKVINENGEKRIAIICQDKDKLNSELIPQYDELIKRKCIYSVIEVKGLEFDLVYVITDFMSENEKYVALSRALKELIVLECLL